MRACVFNGSTSGFHPEGESSNLSARSNHCGPSLIKTPPKPGGNGCLNQTGPLQFLVYFDRGSSKLHCKKTSGQAIVESLLPGNN